MQISCQLDCCYANENKPDSAWTWREVFDSGEKLSEYGQCKDKGVGTSVHDVIQLVVVFIV
jgi:hypothetical protein